VPDNAAPVPLFLNAAIRAAAMRALPLKKTVRPAQRHIRRIDKAVHVGPIDIPRVDLPLSPDSGDLPQELSGPQPDILPYQDRDRYFLSAPGGLTSQTAGCLLL